MLLQRLVKTGFKPTDFSTILSISLYAVFILPMRLNNYASIDQPAKIFAASRKAQVTPLLSYFTNGRFEVHSNPNILVSTLCLYYFVVRLELKLNQRLNAKQIKMSIYLNHYF